MSTTVELTRLAVWAVSCWHPGRAASLSMVGRARRSDSRGAVGGHAAGLEVAAGARRNGVRRVIFAHIGRPTIRAIDAGARPPFGEFGREGHRYRL
jgi:hypothetical protein